MKQLRAAVIGLGMMGRNHARVLGAMPDVEVAALVDIDLSVATAAAHSSGAVPLVSIEDLPDVDIAVVATPTALHFEVASALAARGIHLLVEKPLAPTFEEAGSLVRAAETAGIVLAVGHVERFNAAYGLLGRLLEEPLFISFERLSPFTPRIGDSIVMDLMVHDLDLALCLMGSYPRHLSAAGARVFSDSYDVATAILEFANGCIVTLQASRVTQDKVRRVSISERERFIFADSMRQDVSIKREAAVSYSDDEGSVAYRQANVVEIPYLDRSGEPLAREMRDFVDAVREGRRPMVSGQDGALVVRLAKEIESAIDSHLGA